MHDCSLAETDNDGDQDFIQVSPWAEKRPLSQLKIFLKSCKIPEFGNLHL